MNNAFSRYIEVLVQFLYIFNGLHELIDSSDRDSCLKQSNL